MPYDPNLHGPHRIVGPGFHQKVYAIVREIPRGRVSTYGDIAAILGSRNVARHVGYALAALTDANDDVPWFRVVNSRGRISPRAGGDRQRRHLVKEGIKVNRDTGQIASFTAVRHQWSELA